MKHRLVTLLVIAASVVWTAWILLSGNTDGDWRRFGISNGYYIFRGDYWTLLAAMFVHVDVMHLFFNVYWLYVLGGYVEERYGYRYYSVLILISGFCASTLELSFAGSTGVGLSGVVYAIFGVLWGAQLFGKHTAKVLTKQRIQLFLSWLVLCIVLTASGAMSVGNVAHIVGLLMGLIAAFAQSGKSRAATFAIPTLVVFCGITIFYSPWSYVWLAGRASRAQELSNWEVADVYYSKMIGRRQNDSWPLENRGRIRIYLGREAEGRADLSRAQQLKESSRTRR